jgi:hypothetical protein
MNSSKFRNSELAEKFMELIPSLKEQNNMIDLTQDKFRLIGISCKDAQEECPPTIMFNNRRDDHTKANLERTMQTHSYE